MDPNVKYNLPIPFWLSPDGKWISAEGNHENWARKNNLLTPRDEILYDKYGHSGLYLAMAKKGWVRVFLLPGEINYSKKLRVGTETIYLKLTPAQSNTLYSKGIETNRAVIGEKFISFKEFYSEAFQSKIKPKFQIGNIVEVVNNHLRYSQIQYLGMIGVIFQITGNGSGTPFVYYVKFPNEEFNTNGGKFFENKLKKIADNNKDNLLDILSI